MKRNKLIHSITTLAAFIALTIAFSFVAFPIGGGLTITLIGVPVAIGAYLFGPYVGAILGFVWGTASLIQGVTGYDPTGPILMQYNLFGLIVTCYIPRILNGFLTGLAAFYLKRCFTDKKEFIASSITSILIVILNTSLFLSCYLGFFLSAPEIQDSINTLASKYNFDPNNLWLFVIFGFGANMLLELAVNLIIDTPSMVYLNKYLKNSPVNIDFLAFKSPFDKKDKQENQNNSSNSK